MVLNEQVESGNGIDSLTLTVSAIHVELDIVLPGIGTLTGDIYIARSRATSLCGEPTPTTTPTATPTVTATLTATPTSTDTPTATPI